MIYIDPPYNTGKDYIYNDNYTISVKDAQLLDNIKSADGERYTVKK